MSFNWLVSVILWIWSFIKAIPTGTWSIIAEIGKAIGEIVIHFWELGKLIYQLIISIIQIIAGLK